MYQSLHKWDDALQLATARVNNLEYYLLYQIIFQNHPDIEALRAKYYRHLSDTGQDEKAAEVYSICWTINYVYSR
jgi:hypothetical protein